MPKKGWKLVKIEEQQMFDGEKKIKNNSKINLKRLGTKIYAHFKNIKTGERLQLCFNYSGLTLSSGNDYTQDYVIYD